MPGQAGARAPSVCALQAVEHDCLCSTLRVANSLPFGMPPPSHLMRLKLMKTLVTADLLANDLNNIMNFFHFLLIFV
ncbi:hypothetical protein EUGRSUZ_L02685 [Eucalyptus grandis]|uniref:Bifunctional inhibitor/plant lipid transfer protein/seed storage helical domain-containing protein n=1 Tax=Eucalyptus grandis TaxID=71139 RepID=A0AAD9WHR5_EUCGR|nr:hypothetical protein EUGRSUZ_L02685 [Eucalyptus grandis]